MCAHPQRYVCVRVKYFYEEMKNSPSEETRWMRRALELARRGEALASPNPMVGAVLVKNGRAVGEGFHTYAGLKHAEIVALERAGRAARGATLYVNLEPCCHTGRTGPCTQALIAAGVTRVVAAMADPNPLVSGRGFRELRRARIRVEADVSQEDARRLNEAFACWVRQRRPLVTLKGALTLDGQLALRGARKKPGTVTWLTSPESRAEVQKMRHAADALMTGIGTVLADNPRLTDRAGLSRRRPLLRVVMDTRLRMPLRSKLVQSAQDDLLIFTHANENSTRARALRRAGAEVLRLALRRGRLDVRAAMRELGRRDILSLLLEAGPVLNGAALEDGVVDKVALFYAPRLAGAVTVPFATGGRGRPLGLPALCQGRVRCFGPDLCVEGYLRDVYGNR